MSKLHKYAFSDLYDISSGISSTKEQAGHGMPFVSFSTVFNNYFLPDELPDLMDASAVDQEKYSVKKGDIFITRTSENLDELAMSCVAFEDYPKATFSGFVKRLRPKTSGIAYDKYMAFFLRSEYFRKVINAKTTMTLRASFNEDIFSFLDLYLPDYKEQVKAGDFLYNIEKMIQNNKKINDNLQQMSITTYMHLFYGKKSNGKLGDILIENPKSTIQVGEAKDKSGDFPFFTSGDIILRWTEPIVEGRNTFLNTGGNADVKFYVGKAAYSTDTWCITAKDGMEDYLYLLLNSIKQELKQKYFQGTGLKHLQKPLLKDSAIYIPSKKEIQALNANIKPCLSMISENIRESVRLSSLREWLLPMLMNGQVSFKEEQEENPSAEISGFDQWLTNQGFAARGEVEKDTLLNIYEAMDDDDK